MTTSRLLREVALTVAAVLGAVVLLCGIAVAAFDVHPLLFRSGSMAPAIDTGALAISRPVPASSLEPGDIVSVRTAEGARVTHRVVGVQPAGDGRYDLTLKGDANADPDRDTYPVSEVLRVSWSVPWIGYAVGWLMGPQGLLVLGAYAMAMLFLLMRRPPRPGDPGDPGDSRGSRHRTGPARGRHRRAPVLALKTTAVAAALALGAGPAVAAWVNSAPVTATLAINPYLTCNAGVTANGVTPYLYYKLDEQSVAGLLNPTTAADSSGGNRPGTYQGTTLNPGRTYGETKACKRDTGSAVTFNGSTGYLTGPAGPQPTAANNAWNNLTLSVWFKTTTSSGGRLIGLGSSETGASTFYDRMMYLSGGATNTQLNFSVFPDGFQTISSTPGSGLRDGQWHHAAATLSTTTGMALYVDGVQVAVNAGIKRGQYYGSAVDRAYWRIAYDTHATWPTAPQSNFFAGTLDEVAVYATALPASTITAISRAGR